MVTNTKEQIYLLPPTLNFEFVHRPFRTFNIDTFCSFDPLFKSEITLGNSPVRKEDVGKTLSLPKIVQRKQFVKCRDESSWAPIPFPLTCPMSKREPSEWYDIVVIPWYKRIILQFGSFKSKRKYIYLVHLTG